MGSYQLIYADPPWSFNSKRTGGSMKSGAAAQYDTMSLAAMKALPVADQTAKDCLLVMWWVGSQPREAIELAEAWGFKVRHMNGLVWNKLTKRGLPFFGMGYYTRAGMEAALIAVKGRPTILDHSIRQVRTAKVGRHSEKPAEFRDDLVKLCGDVPRLEMFARATADGWDAFGNEVDSSILLKGEEAA
ncbi:adenine methylase [Ferrimonas balearica]|uniref:MT-A70 family methyltransferase n=1 Tax=Ferrimonas balearica TaxID=44012 RepID=UPI001C975C3E|nr:MT-A70 family methyltransferase [Ferrimonas balearica]MBY6104874.1 adenine methylase [Ferrimonas balearica]